MARDVNHIQVLLTATDLASADLNKAADSIESRLRKMQREGRGTGESFEKLKSQAEETAIRLRALTDREREGTISSKDYNRELTLLEASLTKLSDRTDAYVRSVEGRTSKQKVLNKLHRDETQFLSSVETALRGLTRARKEEGIAASVEDHRRLVAARKEDNRALIHQAALQEDLNRTTQAANLTKAVEDHKRLVAARNAENHTLARNSVLRAMINAESDGRVADEAARVRQETAAREQLVEAIRREHNELTVLRRVKEDNALIDRRGGGAMAGLRNGIAGVLGAIGRLLPSANTMNRVLGDSATRAKRAEKAGFQLARSFMFLFSRMAFITIAIPSVVAGIGLITNAAYGLTGGIAALLGPLGNLTGALIALPAAGAAAAAGLAAVLGVIGPAFGGVFDGMKAIEKNRDTQGQIGADARNPGRKTADPARVGDAQADLAAARREAADAINDAERDLNRTRADGIRRIADAEQELHDKRRERAESIRDAVLELARLRRDAAREIADEEGDLAHTMLQRAERVSEAERDLARMRRDAAESEQDLLNDIADLRKSAADREAEELERLRIIREENMAQERRLAEELAAARTAQGDASGDGVQSPAAAAARVLQAEQSLAAFRAQAAEREANQQRNIALAREATTDEAEKIADKESDLAELRRDNSEKISDAEQDLGQLVRDTARDNAEDQEDLAALRLRLSEEIRDSEVDLTRLRRDNHIADREDVEDLANLRRDEARNLADAQERLADARINAAERIRNAEFAATQASKESNEAAVRATNLMNYELSKLSPLQLKVANQLLAMKERWQELTAVARDRALTVFSGILTDLNRDLPTIAGHFVNWSNALVDVISYAWELGQTPFFRTIFGNLAENAGKNIGVLGQTFVNLGLALAIVMETARPFTDWFFEVVRGWSQMAVAQSAAGRESGALAGYFERTKEVMQVLGGILGNLFTTFVNIGTIGRSTGMGLLKSFEGVSKRWAEITDPEKGKSADKIREFFELSAPVVRTFGRLLSGIGLAFIQFGNNLNQGENGEKFRASMESITKKGGALDSFVDAMTVLTLEFGPKFIEFINQASRALKVLAAEGGPISVLLGFFTGILKVIGDFGEDHPKLTHAIFQISTAFLLWYKVVKPLITVMAFRWLPGLIGKFGAFIGILGRLVKVLRLVQLAIGLAFVFNPVGVIIAAIIGLVALGVLLYKKWKPFRDLVNGLASIVKEKVVGAFDSLKEWIGEFADADWGERFKMVGEAIIDGIWLGIKTIMKYSPVGLMWEYVLKPILEYFGIKSPSTKFFEIGENLILGLANGIAGAVKAIPEALDIIGDAIMDTMGKLWTKIKNAVPGAWSKIKDAVAGAFGTIRSYFTFDNVQNGFVNAVGGVWSAVKDAVGGAWGFIREKVHSAWNILKDWFDLDGVKNGFVNAVGGVWNAVRGAVGGAWQLIREKVHAAWNTLKEWFALPGVVEGMVGALQGIWDALKTAIPAAWGSIIDAIGGVMARMVNLVVGGVNSLVRKFNSIASTLKIPLSIGERKRVRYNADDNSIESLATGGYVQTAPGGVYRVAEAGAKELVLTTDPKHKRRSRQLLIDYARRMGFIGDTVVPSFARGGYVQGAAPPKDPDTAGLANMLFGLGYNVTSGGEYRGTGTFHDRQQALDFGDSVNSMNKLWMLLTPHANKFEELLGPSGSYWNGAFTSEVAKGHHDHIHVAYSGDKGTIPGLSPFHSMLMMNFGEFLTEHLGRPAFGGAELAGPWAKLAGGFGNNFYDLFKKAVTKVKAMAVNGIKSVGSSALNSSLDAAGWAWNKLDVFANGGEITGGSAGSAKPILAHVGEWVLNPEQQMRLANLVGGWENAKQMLFAPSASPSFAGMARAAGTRSSITSSTSTGGTTQIGPIYTTQPDLDIDYIAAKLEARRRRNGD